MSLQISIFDVIALTITVIFALKAHKLKLSRLLLMLVIIFGIMAAGKVFSVNNIKIENAQNAVIILSVSIILFVVISSLLQDTLDKLVDTLLTPKMNTIIGAVIGGFLGFFISSMFCYLVERSYPDVKHTTIFDFYVGAAETFIQKAPELKKEVQTSIENTDVNVPSDIGKTIEELQK